MSTQLPVPGPTLCAPSHYREILTPADGDGRRCYVPEAYAWDLWNEITRLRGGAGSKRTPEEFRAEAKLARDCGYEQFAVTLEEAAGEIERLQTSPGNVSALTRELADLRRQRRLWLDDELRGRVLVKQEEEIGRLCRGISGLKDFLCGECVPCNRVAAEIDALLSAGSQSIEASPRPQDTAGKGLAGRSMKAE